MLSKGIIISIQGWSVSTTEEITIEVANAGAVAIRTDKKINSRIPIIGLKKEKVIERKDYPYITPSIEDVKDIEKWTKLIAVDYRKINKNIAVISEYAKHKGLIIIADIGSIDDYENIIENEYYHSYIATTLSVLYKIDYKPDFVLIEELQQLECKNIIAEGNFSNRHDVEKVLNSGVNNVCIGSAITDIYKNTKKYTSIKF